MVDKDELRTPATLAQQLIVFFQEYVRAHELTTYIDESVDVDNPKEVECYLVPKAEVDSLEDKFKSAALARWGITLH